MSYQVKRTITSLFAGLLFLAAYCLFAIQKALSGTVNPGDLKFWASAMLVFIAVGIVAQIVVQILFHLIFSIGIAIERQESDKKAIDRSIKASMVEDEMDQAISLKSARIGYYIAGAGFIAALVTLVAGLPAEAALHVMFIGFFGAATASNLSQLIMYRRSLPHE